MARISEQTIQDLRQLRERVTLSGVQQQREEVRKHSPYSEKINQAIGSYQEFYLYYSLQLKEVKVTRPSLIKNIDPDLWVSSEKCTNRELMQKGSSPYAYDAEDGRIELHHIGQRYDGPFAELTFKEHMLYGSNKAIHSSENESWRRNPKLGSKYLAEKQNYWKKRAGTDYAFHFKNSFPALPTQNFELPNEIRSEIRDTIEVLFHECTMDDLDYLSDLAKSYSMMKQIGASSMSEFLFQIRAEKDKEIACSFCGAEEYVLYGSYTTDSEKVQRYKCKICGKIFTATNKSLVSGSSFTFIDWIRFIDCLYHGKSLAHTAKILDISERTAHDNRIKLFYALKLLDDKVRLNGDIVIDETYLPLSFKGNHAKNEDFVIPRPTHKRGSENHTVGLSNELVCIACALDEDGNSVAHAAGTGGSSAKSLTYVLTPSIDTVKCIYSDKSPAIKLFAESNGYPIKQAKHYKKGSKRDIETRFTADFIRTRRKLQVMNSYHSRLKRFLERFSGISTSLLSGYLYLFAWKERNKTKDPIEAYRELLAVLTTPQLYIPTEDILRNGLLPDALKIKKQIKMAAAPSTERDREIYRRFAAGETMEAIGKDLGQTKQNISLIINKLRQNGFAYQTEKEKKLNSKQNPTPQARITERTKRILARNYSIYKSRQEWQGPLEEFYIQMVEKHNLSKNSIKNIIAREKRRELLKEEFFIYEDVQFRSLEEVYKEIYSLFLEIKEKNPQVTDTAAQQVLAEKYSFTVGNIQRIIKIMSSDDSNTYFSGKRKTTKVEAFNRDKAIFIDFLKWEGDRREFVLWAMEKYGLSRDYIYNILQACLNADFKRYDYL